MAEINAAYEELRIPDRRRMAADRERGAQGPRDRQSLAVQRCRRAGGGARGAPSDGEPPGLIGSAVRATPAAPGRPVTGRLDTTETFTPRNQTLGATGDPCTARRACRRFARSGPRRAAARFDPTGPLHRRRMRRFRPPASPALTEAQAVEMAFGKFHGHTLGEIAAFEPSYIDWIASTITKDRDLVAAARVIRGRPRRARRPARPPVSPRPLAPADSGHPRPTRPPSSEDVELALRHRSVGPERIAVGPIGPDPAVGRRRPLSAGLRAVGCRPATP